MTKQLMCIVKSNLVSGKAFYLDYNNLLTKVNKQPDMGELCTAFMGSK